MAITQVTYTGNGSTTLYSFSFPYLDETDVKVTLNEVLTTAYTFANATTIQFNTAPGSGVVIRIYRDTDIDTNKAEFYPGSSIRAQNLNDNFDQTLYAVQEIQQYTWNNVEGTIDSTEVWASDDTKVATAAAIDGRIDDKIDTAITSDIGTDGTGITITDDGDGTITLGLGAGLVDLDRIKASDIVTSAEPWANDDNTIATTAKIDDMIDAAITGDIAIDSTGLTLTNDGDGTITLGIGANSIDFDRIKDVDIITQAKQNAGSPAAADSNLFTALAAARRFDTIVQPTTPSGSNWEVGKTWLQNDANLTLSVWNGSAWLGIASGGTFTNQPKVVYVDATAGDDNNDGHRVSRPKQTIKAAINQINADAVYGDGSIVVVAPGVYQEVAPIDIQRPNVSVVGTALRSCIVHPTPATETNALFRVNSGSYLQNLTFTGMKASGAAGNTADPELPVNQGWNVAFYPGATIIKSPYIQNCTNFSDSEINNSNINVINPAGGAAGDIDSAPTGGGLLVDGSVVASNSPLRSMVCDSYTHVGLNGPGILVTNNGYAQCTSSYAFFNTYHIKCLNGGQANLAASTTDFGDRALVADGKSTFAIFTADLSTNANDGDITFTIDAPVANVAWHGSATRPQGNMLVILNGITYPILSATANGTGWDVTISRPNPTNRSENLGLDGAVTTPATASFYLRSMIASSGHTMEYVGSGTDYRALPENGGVPDDTKQIIELNGGKVWTAITDQNGKFKVGDFFEVDQQTGFVTIPSGSIAFDLASDLSPQLGANLDVLNRTISSSTGNVRIDDTLEVNAGAAATPAITFDGDTNTGIYSPGADQVAVATNGTGRLLVDASGNVDIDSTTLYVNASANRVGIGTLPQRKFHVHEAGAATDLIAQFSNATTGGSVSDGFQLTVLASDGSVEFNNRENAYTSFKTNNTERLRITSAGLVGIGTSSPSAPLTVRGGSTSSPTIRIEGGSSGNDNARIESKYNLILACNGDGDQTGRAIEFRNDDTNLVYIDSSGNVGIGTTAPSDLLNLRQGSDDSLLRFRRSDDFNAGSVGHAIDSRNVAGSTTTQLTLRGNPLSFWNNGEAMRIDSSNRLLVGTSSASGVNSNTAPVLAGNFVSFTGSVSANHNTATTLFTLENLNATYMVTAVITGTANAGAYHAVYIIGSVVTNSHSIQALKAGSLLTLSLSGANVQATQGSGVAQTVTWSVTRMANL